MSNKLMTTPYALPSLTLLTPLAIASGGTGQSTATGTGLGVLQTSPTISSPSLTAPVITSSFKIFGGNTITTSTGDTSYAQFVLSGAPVIQSGVIIQANNNNGTFNNSAQLLLQSNGNNATDVVFGQISGSGGDGSSYTIGRGTGAAAALTISSPFSIYNSLTIDASAGNTFLNQTNLYIDAGATQIIQLNSTAATFSIPIIISGLTASLPVFTNGSKQLVSGTTIGSGAVTLATSPTITTPTLTSPIINTSLTVLGSSTITTSSGLGHMFSSLIGSTDPTFLSSITINGDSRDSNNAIITLDSNGALNEDLLLFTENQFGTQASISKSGVNSGLLFNSNMGSGQMLYDPHNSQLLTNSLNLVVASGNVSVDSSHYFSTGGNPFAYSSGLYTPEILTNSGLGGGGALPSSFAYVAKTGAYRKIGQIVTLDYYVEFTYNVGGGAGQVIWMSMPPSFPMEINGSTYYTASGVTSSQSKIQAFIQGAGYAVSGAPTVTSGSNPVPTTPSQTLQFWGLADVLSVTIASQLEFQSTGDGSSQRLMGQFTYITSAPAYP